MKIINLFKRLRQQMQERREARIRAKFTWDPKTAGPGAPDFLLGSEKKRKSVPAHNDYLDDSLPSMNQGIIMDGTHPASPFYHHYR